MKRLIVGHQTVVNASQIGTDTPASSRRFQGEPSRMRLFIPKNRTHQSVTLQQQCSTLLFVYLLQQGLRAPRHRRRRASRHRCTAVPRLSRTPHRRSLSWMPLLSVSRILTVGLGLETLDEEPDCQSQFKESTRDREYEADMDPEDFSNEANQENRVA